MAVGEQKSIWLLVGILLEYENLQLQVPQNWDFNHALKVLNTLCSNGVFCDK